MHKFTKTFLKEDQEKVIEHCLICDAKAVRYKNGRLSYINDKGSITPSPTLCKNDLKQIKQFNDLKQEDLESKLREAIVIIKVLKEDCERAKIYNNAVIMANNFIGSLSTKSVINYLDYKSK